MIGTEEGCWFSLMPRGERTDYEFYQGDILLEHGSCGEEDEVFVRFDAMVKARRSVAH